MPRRSFAALPMAALLACALGTAPLQAQPALAEPSGTGRTNGPSGASGTNGVTLITGDRVTIAGRGYHIEPGPGRNVGFTRQVLGGHLYVIPSDARPLIADGTLDRRLFDITQLLEWRYGDADRTDIPLITQTTGEQAPAAPQGALQTRPLADLGMTALRVPKANTAQAWKDLTGGPHALSAGRTKLWLDGRRSFTLDRSVKQIGAPQAWQQGLTGKGVTVAILDTGYDPTHPDLKGVVTQERNFSDEPDIRDTFGHGTHIASIIAGAGQKYRGVAPDAKLAIGKLGGRDGGTDSAILAGMEWAAVEVKAKIVNMSFGSTDTPELDPLEQAVNTLSERTGTLFVVAAGNRGNGKPTMASPGSADAALTVGAVDHQDKVAGFSSAGPRQGDHAIKPDVTAPGVDITAAAAAGTADGPYVTRSGTSMAAPHVVGAAAILAQRHPEWTGQQLKAALIGSAAPAAGATAYQQGAGRIDLVRALAQQVTAEPGNVWAAFPWKTERVNTKTITYTNSGDSPVTLDLTAEGEVLKLSTQRLEVPAGGKASVTLTLDATGKAPGDYPGTITATSGQTVVRALAGAYVEPESYDVTVTLLGRDGEPSDGSAQLYDPKTGDLRLLSFENGTATLRVPEGEWGLHTSISQQGSGITIAHTTLKVDGADQRITVDARQGKQARHAIDDPAAVLRPGVDFGIAEGAWNQMEWDPTLNANEGVFLVPVRKAGLEYIMRTVWDGAKSSQTPYLYDLADHRSGGIPDSPTYTAKRHDLAKVTTAYPASGVTATGVSYSGPRFHGLDFSQRQGEVNLPGTFTYYRTPGLVWDSALRVGTSWLQDNGRNARRGHTHETWNAAVSGPSFTVPGGERTGDHLTFPAGNLFADGVTGRIGADDAATGTATLTRDRQTLAKTDLTGCATEQVCELDADLPAENAAYTLTTSMRRQVPHSTLSTAVETVWTFQSARTDKAQPLPLSAVRYIPAGLDEFNRAKPGSLTQLPIRIERNPGAAQTATALTKLEISTDDGATWQRVPAVRTTTGWTATVRNPGTPGFVSLRATVTGASGTGLTQTITRAYAVG
ncbi:S8 family serine peptidase [Streptosporangium sp. NPDC051023]|uniref:S8 family serine peptidase n=1 Tax=Streptosporangium sp. NPDC051023 TaxID=3155410 RepID=UPI00344E6C45